jgi:hypothetical protein
MTRPETLGPVASIAEAGTLVSSDQLYRFDVFAYHAPLAKHLLKNINIIQIQLLLKLHFTREIRKNNTRNISA